MHDEQSRPSTLDRQVQEPPTVWQMSLVDPFTWQLHSVYIWMVQGEVRKTCTLKHIWSYDTPTVGYS